MKKVSFSTTINAPKEKVWNALWDDTNYRRWTSPFCEGSYAVTEDWKEGTKVLFLAPDGGGMVSTVAVNKPNEFMSFKHLGEVKDGVEDTTSDKVKAWAGALENYTLIDKGDATTLLVEVDISETEAGFFTENFPTALEQVKMIAETT